MANQEDDTLSMSPSSGLQGCRVLICDDSALQRRKLQELYTSLGMECVGECSNGLECLSAVEMLKPDLVSLDILMPVMHGIETLTYLRESGFQGYIILVSAIGADKSVTDFAFGQAVPDAIFSKKDSKESFRVILEQMFEAGSQAQQKRSIPSLEKSA